MVGSTSTAKSWRLSLGRASFASFRVTRCEPTPNFRRTSRFIWSAVSPVGVTAPSSLPSISSRTSPGTPCPPSPEYLMAERKVISRSAAATPRGVVIGSRLQLVGLGGRSRATFTTHTRAAFGAERFAPRRTRSHFARLVSSAHPNRWSSDTTITSRFGCPASSSDSADCTAAGQSADPFGGPSSSRAVRACPRSAVSAGTTGTGVERTWNTATRSPDRIRAMYPSAQSRAASAAVAPSCW